MELSQRYKVGDKVDVVRNGSTARFGGVVLSGPIESIDRWRTTANVCGFTIGADRIVPHDPLRPVEPLPADSGMTLIGTFGFGGEGWVDADGTRRGWMGQGKASCHSAAHGAN